MPHHIIRGGVNLADRGREPNPSPFNLRDVQYSPCLVFEDVADEAAFWHVDDLLSGGRARDDGRKERGQFRFDCGR